jgi:hypothetical protein
MADFLISSKMMMRFLKVVKVKIITFLRGSKLNYMIKNKNPATNRCGILNIK